MSEKTSAQDLLRSADNAVFEVADELRGAVQTLRQRAQRVVDLERIATAEQRARAEQAEEALRAIGAKPGEPVEWRGPAVVARVVCDKGWTNFLATAGLDGVATRVFGRIGEAGEAAIVGIQPHAAWLGPRDVRVELWLDLKPGGSLDQLADVVGKLVQARDAAAVSARLAAEVETTARPIAGSAT